jgi:membrane protein DedA with SNARE-associated domain
MTDKRKTYFLIRNLIRGFLYLALIVTIFIIAKDKISVDYFEWFAPIYENPLIMYMIFLTSEVIIGIIPPEFFMVWALGTENLTDYSWNVALLAIISYAAGLIGYGIGRYFNQSRFYRFFKRKYFGKYSRYLHEFGGFLVVVAATTPVPFSGISMLVGSERFPFKKYLYFSLFRFIRFVAYATIIWEANIF